MMKTNLRFALVSALTMVCLVFTSCAPAATPSAAPSVSTEAPSAPAEVPSAATEAAASSQVKRGGVLKVLMGSSFQELDPAHNESQTDDIPIFLVYEALLKWDPETLEPMPGLAKSWQVSEDGLTYTFELEEGVKWHNGDPLTADDVKYSVERILDPDEPTFKAGWIDSIESVDVPDSLTVVFHLKEPFSPLLSYLPWTPMIQNRSFVEANGGQTPRTMMGTGPFMFSEWIPDQVFRLEANPNYWRIGDDGQPLPYLDGIEFYVNNDSTAMMAQFLAGEVDMTATVPTSSIQSLEDDPDVLLAGPACIAYAALWMHTTTPPYDDARVRQAVAWAIDRDEIVNVGLLGAADPIHGGLLPDWHWASTHYTVYDHRDVDKALDLLAEAGYADGFQTTIVTPPSDAYITVAEMSASYMREVGIEASVEVQEEGAFFDNFLSERLPIYILGSAFSGDPDEIYYMDFHTGGAYNPLSYSNPEVDRLTEEARATSDLNERKALYRQVEEIVLRESPQALVSMDHCSEALHSYVKGYVHIANDIYMGLDEVWLDM